MFRLLIWRNALRPSLSLSFTDYAPLPSAIAFSRASAGWRFNTQGVLEQVASDMPRQDTDPAALTPRGLLIEEQRTNSIRTSSGTGAVAGVLGSGGSLPTNWSYAALAGVTVTVQGTGTEDGIPYIDLGLSGSATGNVVIGYEGGNSIASVNGESWSSSAFYRLLSGSLSNASLAHQLVERNSGGALLATSDLTLTPSGGALRIQRQGVTRALNQATTAYSNTRLLISCAGAVSLGLRIGCPQQEKGAHVSSPILTTTSAVTRAADVAVVQGMGWHNVAQGAMLAEFERPQDATASGQIVEINDGSTQNRLSLSAASVYQVEVTASGASQALMGSFPTATGIVRLAGIWRAYDFAAACSTSGSMDSDSSGAMPAGVNQLVLGSRAANDTVLNGWLRRVQYWPKRLNNAVAQKLAQ